MSGLNSSGPSPSDPDFDPTSPEVRLRDLEHAMATLIWLHEEKRQQVERLATCVAGLLAQQMQPRVTEAIKRQLAGQAPTNGAGWLAQLSPDTLQ